MADDDGGGTATVDAAPAVAAAPAPAAPAAAPVASAAPAAPAPGPAAAPAPTEPAPDKPGDWNEKWRELMASGDEKELKQLERYGSPIDVWKKARELERRQSSGELKPTLPKKPTPEQLKEWRAAHGVPEDPSGYVLPDEAKKGIDESIVAEVLKDAHATNQTPEQVKATLDGVRRAAVALAESRAESDIDFQKDAEDELRGEWGTEFRRNISLVHQLLDSTAEPALKEQLLQGRLADGRPIGSHPGMLRMLLGLALQANPAGTLAPGAGADPVKGMREELTKLQGIPTSKKTEADSRRERELIEVAVKMKVMNMDGTWAKP
jgi:hypothetical protein